MVAIATPRLTAEQLTLKPGDAVICTHANQTEHAGTVAVGPMPGRDKCGKAGWMIFLVGRDQPCSLRYVRPLRSACASIQNPKSKIQNAPCGAVGSGACATFNRCRRLFSCLVDFASFVAGRFARVRRRVAGKRISSPACPSRPPATLSLEKENE